MVVLILVRKYQPAERAVLPLDGCPLLMKAGGSFDVQVFHGAVIIRARAGFGLHGKWYTILRGEKGSGA